MFEVSGVAEQLARESLKLAAQKLPVSTTILTRTDAIAAVS
jgi:ribosomal protein L16/L10AE